MLSEHFQHIVCSNETPKPGVPHRPEVFAGSFLKVKREGGGALPDHLAIRCKACSEGTGVFEVSRCDVEVKLPHGHGLCFTLLRPQRQQGLPLLRQREDGLRVRARNSWLLLER